MTPTRVSILRARRLRSEMTGVEAMLWQELRLRKVAGFKFRRQVPVGRFVLDFACVRERLAVEIDGPSHNFTGIHDYVREQWLTAIGWRVLHFTPEDVLCRRQQVLDTLEAVLTDSSVARPSVALRATPPRRAGEEIQTAQL